jgi:hypothetical protein
VRGHSDYDFVQLLEDNWEAIYAEYLQVKDEPAGYEEIHSSVSGGKWTAFNLCTCLSFCPTTRSSFTLVWSVDTHSRLVLLS